MSVSKGTEDLPCLQDANAGSNFLEICSICTFQVKFSSIFIPRDLVNSACFIELLSIVKGGSI